jgi:hypothetical protein
MKTPWLQLSDVLDEALAKLARENWRLALHQAEGAPLLLLGRGGRLLDILVGSEFNEIVVRSPVGVAREDFLRFASTKSGLVERFELRKSGYEVLQFSSAEMANSALNSLREMAPQYSINEKDIGPWRAIAGQTSKPAAFELRVEVERRQNQGMAFIHFTTEEQAAAAARKLRGQLIFVMPPEVLGMPEIVTVQANKRDDKRALFCWLQDKGSTQVKNVTEVTLLAALRDLGVDPTRVRIPKEREFESSRAEQEAVRLNITNALTSSRICSPSDFWIDLKRPQPKDFTWVAWLRFQSSASGLRCARYCEVRKYLQ